MADLIERARAYAQTVMQTYDPGHDHLHVERVLRLSRYLSQFEGGDLEIISLAAILHDVDDHKFRTDTSSDEPVRLQEWLETQQLSEEKSAHLIRIVSQLGYQGSAIVGDASSIEHAVVCDADRLDAMGAIGIARAFSYGGFKRRPFFDPENLTSVPCSREEYVQRTEATINHFFEKLLQLKHQMHTATGRAMAESRDAVMRQYVATFLDEWFLGVVPPEWAELIEGKGSSEGVTPSRC